MSQMDSYGGADLCFQTLCYSVRPTILG